MSARSAADNILRGPIPINRIEPYYKIAQKAANESPCVRRQYGAVIAYDDFPTLVSATNARVTKACEGACIRERYGVVHGSRTELGAEVHAEQAALIDAPKKGVAFILAGYKDDQELVGRNVYPCLVCARMIKYAGYTYVYMKNDEGQIEPISIYDIIEYREGELGPHYE
jgi:deoxycytidylate deaminase